MALKVRVLEKYCKGCGLCVAACPKKILRLGSVSNNKGYYVVECTDPEACVGCAACAHMCPDSILEVER